MSAREPRAMARPTKPKIRRRARRDPKFIKLKKLYGSSPFWFKRLSMPESADRVRAEADAAHHVRRNRGLRKVDAGAAGVRPLRGQIPRSPSGARAGRNRRRSLDPSRPARPGE